jgi:hypothetical protein
MNGKWGGNEGEGSKMIGESMIKVYYMHCENSTMKSIAIVERK